MAKPRNLIKFIAALSLLAFLLALTAGCIRFLQPYEPIDIKSLQGSGQIMFVPIGNISQSSLRDIARYYQQKYGLNIEIRPNLEIPSEAYDSKREQLIAQNVAASLLSRYSNPDDESKTIIIGITNRDIYIRDKDWKYAFGYYRWDYDQHVGVISSARMDDAFFGNASTSEAVQISRLRKMISKYIGLFYYDLPQSPDSRSVMYDNIMSPSDLDGMGEEF